MQEYYHYKREITIADSDTDFTGRLKPGAILDYFQAAATAHAELSGYGYEDLLKRNVVWVIVRMSIKILKYPAIGDTLSLFTFPEKPRSADVDRGYYMYNEAGEAVVLGASKWCVIDINTHKIQRLTPLFESHNFDNFIPNPPFENANPKLEEVDGNGYEQNTQTFTVQLTDLDRNIHMNNARYGDVILNACGMEAVKNRGISRVDINYVSQLFYDEKYEVHTLSKDDTTYIKAQKTAGDVVFRARVEWQVKEEM